MKTEMKMIAAILAVLAVALGGVYALDTAQAEEIDETQAIWPAPAYDEDNQYAQWSKDGSPRDAEWVSDVDSGAVYWMDIVNGGAWFTVLDGTEFEFDGLHESFRVKAEGALIQNPANPDDQNPVFDWDNIQIEFYNFRDGYTLVSGQVMPIEGSYPHLNPNAKQVETDIGTLYLNAVPVYIQLNKSTGTGAVTVKTTIPVLVVEKIDVTGEYEYAYVYNSLEQTPIKALGGDNSDASTPYVHFNDCFDEYADYGIVWKYSGTTSETDTNKLKALNKVGAVGYDFENGYYYDANGDAVFPVMEAYTATLTPTGSKYIEGTITITWWIMPLGLEDVNFTVKDVAYDYDNEVVPTVANKDIVMKWCEPEDGPNGAKPHYLGFGASVPFYDVSYGVPADFPEEYIVSVPVYDEQGNPVYVQKMVDGEPVEMQLRDQYGRLMFTDFEEELDEQGNPTGEIVMETVQDCDIVYAANVDAEGKIVFQAVDMYGRLMFVDELDDEYQYMVPVGESDWYVTDDEDEFNDLYM